jgi:hypothetical protein
MLRGVRRRSSMRHDAKPRHARIATTAGRRAVTAASSQSEQSEKRKLPRGPPARPALEARCVRDVGVDGVVGAETGSVPLAAADSLTDDVRFPFVRKPNICAGRRAALARQQQIAPGTSPSRSATSWRSPAPATTPRWASGCSRSAARCCCWLPRCFSWPGRWAGRRGRGRGP